MILRRPYAFLIKNFKIIHIIMFLLLGYTTYRASNIVSFFKDYIQDSRTEILPNFYSFGLVYFFIILFIISSIAILYLMKYKNKPRLIYIISIIISVIAFILFIYLGNTVYSLTTTSVTGRVLRLYRDISRINYYMLFIMCIPFIIRGLGFDIKKFNFNKDLMELNINEEDSAEVEVNVDLTPDGLKRRGRKYLRELSYYYKEYKLFINVALIIVGIGLILAFPFNIFVINRPLSEGETLITKDYNMIVDDSYITTRKRTSMNNTYVILKVKIKGKVNKYTINIDSLVLQANNNSYKPSLKYYNYFMDIGYGYKKTYLVTDEYKEYLLIYNVDNKDTKKLSLYNLDSDKKVRLKPETIS